MMAQSSATTPPFAFYGFAILLLLVAVTVALVQKHFEDRVGTSVATRIAAGLKDTDQTKSEVQSLIRKAGCWEVVGAVAVLLALLSSGAAVWRHERCRWVWIFIVVLLAVYVGLEFLMV
jgi:cell division protein FtsW (lipid II flippase)